MKILLINVDADFNIAIRKMYNYFLKEGHNVRMYKLGFSGYPHNKSVIIDANDYDRVYVSNIFEINKDRVIIRNGKWVEYGGIGSINPDHKLPKEIEDMEPYYFDYEDTSYGFITRGCIRNCSFCKVPKYEGKLTLCNTCEKIVKHKKAIFLDNNILAYDGCCDVFRWLINHNVRCEFNQGLDFRLVNDENLSLLSQLNYMGNYIFAFDNEMYEPILNEKIKLIKKYLSKPWIVKFYIYFHPTMAISGLIYRINWVKSHECLPYIMRDFDCYTCEYKDFLTDLSAYCNQPAFFKKMEFETFLHKRLKDENRIEQSVEIWNKNNIRTEIINSNCANVGNSRGNMTDAKNNGCGTDGCKEDGNQV